MKKKSYLSKQLAAVLVIVTVLAVTIPLYFAVLRPYFAKNKPETQTTAAPYIEGERLSGTSLRMMAVAEDPARQLYTLNDGSASWSFYVSEGNIYIKDYELTPYDGNHMIFLRSALASPMATRILPTEEQLSDLRSAHARTMSSAELEALGGEDHVAVPVSDVAELSLPLEDYGFGDLSSLPYYETTDQNGVTHKIYLGDYAPDGSSRYAMYDGRNAVYLISGTVAPYFTLTVEQVASPILTAVPSDAESNYVPDRFIIYRGTAPYVDIVLYDSATALSMDRLTKSVLVKHIYDDEDGKPVYNTYNTSPQYVDMLYNYFRASIFGKEVVAVTPCEPIIENGKRSYRQKQIDDATLASFGISKEEPYRAFSSEKDGIMNLLLFSQPKEDEQGRYYYVYNAQYQFIVKTYADSMPFMEEDETYYVSPYVSLLYVDTLSALTIDSTGLKEKYRDEWSGLVPLKETFSLSYRMNATGTERALDDDGSAILEKVLLSSGKTLPDVGKVKGPENFRNLYQRIQMIRMYTNVEDQMDEILKIDPASPDVSVSYELYGGRSHRLNFYFYGSSGNLCFYTYDDGKERYVVNAKDVANVLKGVRALQEGQSVDEVLGSIV